jgi:predicted lipoprotein with Yx(FWY)xxD motif
VQRRKNNRGAVHMAGKACIALAAAAGLLASGCGGSAATSSSGQGTRAKVMIKVRAVHGLGKVLVTGKGYVLYMFEPDGRRAVTCTGACAGTWPPVKLPTGAAAGAEQGVESSLLGSDPDPAGGRVLTYNGWPLYTYSGDVEPGQATGQAIDLNGGEWYVIRPSGQPLIPSPQS